MKRLRWLLLPALLLLLGGCLEKGEEHLKEPLKFAVNPWVGYAPFMYLAKSGRLEALGFKMVLVSSLGENANLMSNHLVDGFAATQYEYINFRDELHDVVPLFTIDRSAGADKVHANVPIKTLQKTDKPIDVYLEFGSCNEDIFRAFVKAYGLQNKRFVFHHDPQSVIKNLRVSPSQIVVVISYEPFSTTLEQNGIHEVASSANLDILIVDAFFTFKNEARAHMSKFRALQKAFWEAQAQLVKDPETFYQNIREFLEGQSFEDFNKSLSGIRWLPRADATTKKRLQEQGVATDLLP